MLRYASSGGTRKIGQLRCYRYTINPIETSPSPSLATQIFSLHGHTRQGALYSVKTEGKIQRKILQVTACSRYDSVLYCVLCNNCGGSVGNSCASTVKLHNAWNHKNQNGIFCYFPHGIHCKFRSLLFR